MERCSPWPAPFSPQAPPKIALLCSSGSSIVWRGPTPPERACPPCGFGPSRTGLVPLRGRGAPEVSRFSCMLFLSVRGFFDYAGPTARSRLSRNSRVAFLHQERVGILILRFSKLNRPAHRYPCLRFERYLTMSPARLRGQDGVPVSLLVGLFHSLQHAGLSRRTLTNAINKIGALDVASKGETGSGYSKRRLQSPRMAIQWMCWC
jgi:hypothetical protein